MTEEAAGGRSARRNGGGAHATRKRGIPREEDGQDRKYELEPFALTR